MPENEFFPGGVEPDNIASPAPTNNIYQRNAPFAKSGPYTTSLSEKQESQFRSWVKNNKVPFDPNEKNADYDMRGYWKDVVSRGKNETDINPVDKKLHFPDTYKTPYHESFSAESKYATANNPFKWHGQTLTDERSGKPVFKTTPNTSTNPTSDPFKDNPFFPGGGEPTPSLMQRIKGVAGKVVGGAERVGKGLEQIGSEAYHHPVRTATGVIPGVGAGIQAYQQPQLDPLTGKALSTLYGGEHSPLYGALKQGLAQHPAMRALAAGSVHLPVDLGLMWLAGGLDSLLFDTVGERVFSNTAQKVAMDAASNAVDASTAAEAVSAARTASAAVFKRRIQRTLAGGAIYGELQAGQHKLEGDYQPDEWILDPIAGMAFSAVLHPLSQAASRFTPFIKPAVNKLVESNPAFKPYITDINKVATTLTREGQLPAGQAARHIEDVMTGKADLETLDLMRGFARSHPEWFSGPFGEHLAQKLMHPDDIPGWVPTADDDLARMFTKPKNPVEESFKDLGAPLPAPTDLESPSIEMSSDLAKRALSIGFTSVEDQPEVLVGDLSKNGEAKIVSSVNGKPALTDPIIKAAPKAEGMTPRAKPLEAQYLNHLKSGPPGISVESGSMKLGISTHPTQTIIYRSPTGKPVAMAEAVKDPTGKWRVNKMASASEAGLLSGRATIEVAKKLGELGITEPRSEGSMTDQSKNLRRRLLSVDLPHQVAPRPAIPTYEAALKHVSDYLAKGNDLGKLRGKPVWNTLIDSIKHGAYTPDKVDAPTARVISNVVSEEADALAGGDKVSPAEYDINTSKPEIQHLLGFANAFADRAGSAQPSTTVTLQSLLKNDWAKATRGMVREHRGWPRTVTDLGDGSAAIVEPFGVGTRVNLDDIPEIAEAATPYSRAEREAAETVPISQRPNALRPPEAIRAALDRVEDEINKLDQIRAKEGITLSTKAVKAGMRIHELRQWQAELYDALGQDPASDSVGAALKMKLGFGPKGGLPGAIKIGGPKNITSTPVGRLATAFGHKAVWELPDGRIKVDTKQGVPLYADSPGQLAAALERFRRAKSDALHTQARIEREIETGEMNAVPANPQDNFTLGFWGLLHTLSDKPTFQQSKGMTKVHGVETPVEAVGLLGEATTKGALGEVTEPWRVLNRMGNAGRRLGFKLKLRLDGEIYGHQVTSRVLEELDKTLGPGERNRDDFYSGKLDRAKLARVRQMDSIIEHDRVAAGLEPRKRFDDLNLPRTYPLNQVLKDRGMSLSDAMVDQAVKDGLGDNRQDVIRKMLDTDMFVHSDEQKTVGEMVQRLNARNQELAARQGIPFNPVKPEEALDTLNQYRNRGARLAYTAEMEARLMPGYEKDILKAYRTKWHRDIADISDALVFGPKGESLQEDLHWIRRHVGDAAYKRARFYTDAVRGQIHRPNSVLDAIFDIPYHIARGAYLQFSWMYHVPQGFYIAQRLSAGEMVRGIGRAMKASPVEARDLGIALDRVFEDMRDNPRFLDSEEGMDHPRIAKLTNAARKYGDFGSLALRYAINTMRRIGFHTGEIHFDRMVERLRKNPTDKSALRSLNEAFGAQLSPEFYTRMTDAQHAAGRGLMGKRAAAYAMFDFDPLTTPQFATTNMGRLVFQFRNFLYGMTGISLHETFGKDVPIGRRLKAIMTTMAYFPLSGAAEAGLRNVLTGGSRSSRDVSKKVDQFFKNPSMGKAMAAYVAMSQYSHAYGVVGDIVGALATGNTEMLRLFDTGLPVVGPEMDLIKLGGFLGHGVNSAIQGEDMLAQYYFTKASQTGAPYVPYAGQIAQHRLVGPAKKPGGKDSGGW